MIVVLHQILYPQFTEFNASFKGHWLEPPESTLFKQAAWMQSHYREDPWWGVSNGARNNWKFFLAYKRFHISLINQNVPKIISFHLRYMMVSLVKIFWSYKGRTVGHLAQIQPKSQFLFHNNLLPQDFSIMTLLEGRFL